MDLFWRENLICPTEPEYIEMVNNSTSLSSPYPRVLPNLTWRPQKLAASSE